MPRFERKDLPDACPALVDAWAEAALKVKRDAIILVHGGPVSAPEDADYVIGNTVNCHGFYGASSMERLPTEKALTEQTRLFKAIKGGKRSAAEVKQRRANGSREGHT